jgi:hypothetical protein
MVGLQWDGGERTEKHRQIAVEISWRLMSWTSSTRNCESSCDISMINTAVVFAETLVMINPTMATKEMIVMVVKKAEKKVISIKNPKYLYV